MMKKIAPEHGRWLYVYRIIYREQTPQSELSACRMRGSLTPAHSTDTAALQNYHISVVMPSLINGVKIVSHVKRKNIIWGQMGTVHRLK